jgi:uncharacterized membrane protein
MSEDSLWQGVHYLHLLAMAFFVGGQLVVVAAVMPVERRYSDRTRLRAIARRFGIGSLLALVVLAATGSAMAAHWGYWGSGTLQIKLGLVGLVVCLTTLHLVWPRLHVLSAAVLAASLAIVWFGLVLAH